MSSLKPATDKSLGATLRLLAIPALVAAGIAYLFFINWHAGRQAQAACAMAKEKPVLDTFRRRLQAEGINFRESRMAPEATIIMVRFNGMPNRYFCEVDAKGQQIVSAEAFDKD